MDPSHARKYKESEIEVIVARILSKAYPNGINIPIDIDRIAQSIDRFAECKIFVDDIIPAELLEDKFNVAAVLISKPEGHFDILVDDDTITFQSARASFSIAHELGHIVLHSQICSDCLKIEDVIVLNKRIEKIYTALERNANYFAGAILIPQRTLPEHASKLYEGLVKMYGYDINLIPSKLCSRLAEQYGVNTHPMEIRLKELNLQRKIKTALYSSLPYIDP